MRRHMMRVHERPGSFPLISVLASGPEAGHPVVSEGKDLAEESFEDDEENGEDAKVGASLALPAMMRKAEPRSHDLFSMGNKSLSCKKSLLTLFNFNLKYLFILEFKYKEFFGFQCDGCELEVRGSKVIKKHRKSVHESCSSFFYEFKLNFKWKFEFNFSFKFNCKLCVMIVNGDSLCAKCDPCGLLLRVSNDLKEHKSSELPNLQCVSKDLKQYKKIKSDQELSYPGEDWAIGEKKLAFMIFNCNKSSKYCKISTRHRTALELRQARETRRRIFRVGPGDIKIFSKKQL